MWHGQALPKPRLPRPRSLASINGSRDQSASYCWCSSYAVPHWYCRPVPCAPDAPHPAAPSYRHGHRRRGPCRQPRRGGAYRADRLRSHCDHRNRLTGLARRVAARGVAERRCRAITAMETARLGLFSMPRRVAQGSSGAVATAKAGGLVRRLGFTLGEGRGGDKQRRSRCDDDGPGHDAILYPMSARGLPTVAAL